MEFFSNKQRYVAMEDTNTLFDEQSICILIDMGCIHLNIPKENKLYDGRLFCKKDGVLIFITYDGLVLISVLVAGNKVINIGIHWYNGDILSKSVVYEQKVDYSDIYRKIESRKISDDGQIIALRRDRRNKIVLLTRPEYDINGIQKLFKNDLYKFDSYYLTWLKFYTLGQDFELPILMSVLKAMQDVNMLDCVMLTDRMQCLGVALCLCELADRFAINMNLPNYETIMSFLVGYAFFVIMIYIATYKGEDSLKDTELLAIQGRLCDLHKSRLVPMFINCNMTNMAFIDDMYIYCMYSASQSSPNVFLRTEYFKNALMMHQNQTLVGVTKDQMDESFIDSINIGFGCMNQLIEKMTMLYKSGHLSIPAKTLCDIDSGLEKIIQSSLKDMSRNNIKSFCLIHQVKQYDGHSNANILKPVPARCSLDKFLKNIGVSHINGVKLKGEKEIKVMLKNGDDCHINNNIYSILISWDDNDNLQGIKISCTNGGHELKKRIDRTHIFYGFVCQISLCDLNHAPQTIILSPFLVNDAI